MSSSVGSALDGTACHLLSRFDALTCLIPSTFIERGASRLEEIRDFRVSLLRRPPYGDGPGQLWHSNELRAERGGPVPHSSRGGLWLVCVCVRMCVCVCVCVRGRGRGGVGGGA